MNNGERWYVSRDKERFGPFEEEQMVQKIHDGKLVATDLVCGSGQETWVGAGKHPTFMHLFVPAKTIETPKAAVGVPVTASGKVLAEAVPSVPEGKASNVAVAVADALPTIGTPPAPPTTKVGTSIWAIASTLACILTVISVATVGWIVEKNHRQENARLDSLAGKVDLVTSELKAIRAPGDWVPETEVLNNCHTDRSTVTCTYTNVLERPVTTCSKGVLAQKEATGVRLESLVMCTGRLEPGTTKVVTAPWNNGFADDICNKQTAYGKVLDWSKCDFVAIGVDLPTVRRIRAAAGTK